MTNEDFLPIVVRVRPSRMICVICYVGASLVTEHEFPWDEQGVRDAIDQAQEHSNSGEDRDVHIFLSGTEHGLFIKLSHEKEKSKAYHAQLVDELETNLRDQLTWRPIDD